jgi:ubiquitin C-terminal hydrolase
MSFSTLHVILILTLAIFISIVNTGNYCFRNCALQIIAHILPLREYILDDKTTGAYTDIMCDVLRRMLDSQCAISVPLTPFLVEPSFYMFHNVGERE